MDARAEKPTMKLNNHGDLNYIIEQMDENFIFNHPTLPRELNGKIVLPTIPFIGWFWRPVDFEHDGAYTLGIYIEQQSKAIGIPYEIVAFNESGKYLVDHLRISRREWRELKEEIRKFIECQTQNSFDKVINLMQSFLKTGKRFKGDDLQELKKLSAEERKDKEKYKTAAKRFHKRIRI